MKKIISILFIFVIAFIGYKYLDSSKIVEAEKDKDWKVFKKKDKALSKHTPTEDELTKAKIPTKRIDKKSSVKVPMLRDRRLLGNPDAIKKVQNNEIDLEFVNSPSDEWKENMAEKILNSQRPDTDIFIKPENSIVQLEGEDKARYVEHVLVAVKRPEDLKQTYEAIVDSETGRILKTWNSITYERNPKKGFSTQVE